MFDQLIFVAIVGVIIFAILALLKVMIDYPGFGTWCMRIIHKNTAEKQGKENEGIEEKLDTEDVEEGAEMVSHMDKFGIDSQRILRSRQY